MRIKLIILCILLSGCYSAKYEFTRCTQKDVCSTAKIHSKREFTDGILVEYNDQTKAYKVEAGRVTAPPNPLEQIGAQVLTDLLKKYTLQGSSNENQ